MQQQHATHMLLLLEKQAVGSGIASSVINYNPSLPQLPRTRHAIHIGAKNLVDLRTRTCKIITIYYRALHWIATLLHACTDCSYLYQSTSAVCWLFRYYSNAAHISQNLIILLGELNKINLMKEYHVRTGKIWLIPMYGCMVSNGRMFEIYLYMGIFGDLIYIIGNKCLNFGKFQLN